MSANMERRVNWARGFSRASYAGMALTIVVWLVQAISSHRLDFVGVGLGFATAWWVAHRIVAWIARGFSGD